MSIARHHAEWLSLVPVSGPFLSLPVLMQAFPQGLDAHDAEHARLLRRGFEEWGESQQRSVDPAVHDAWIKFVLTNTLEFDAGLLLEGQAIPQTLHVEMAEHGELLKPDIVLNDPATKKPRLLVRKYPRTQPLTGYVAGSRWKASPETRMADLLHGTGVRLGLVTNGEHWMLVDAPKGETTGCASWYASLWREEKITLQAFRSLLSMQRFFGVPDDQTIEALLTQSASNQQEVTDQLGAQVLRAVEVLIQSLDKADQDHGRQLLEGVTEAVLYESALNVMMRLVFLFCAEERELIPTKPFPVYEQNYSVSTISSQLREIADQHGEELLERRYDAWPRVLASFRAVYGGLAHNDVHMPAYGGRLFDPDRFPFLEGRQRNSTWTGTPASPLPVNNRTVLHLLEALQLLQVKLPGRGPVEARRISFQALNIEQIGHVYEGLLDHTAKRATEPVLGLIGKKEPEVAVNQLVEQRSKGDEELFKLLKDQTGSSRKWANYLDNELSDRDTVRLRTACANDETLFQQVMPFAGLLRNDSFGYPVVIPKGSIYVTAGTDRRSSGTHYTPRSLTIPIVQYTLEPLVYVGPAEGKQKAEWQLKPAAELLDLKICDMACGSGAFLVQAARYMADRLMEAWDIALEQHPGVPGITPEGKPATGARGESLIPADPAERTTYAMRIVAQRCLYGVDINPLAVEMAKLSLWLLTLAKDKPFEFLDHAIRCGDSLVGLHNINQLRHFSLKPDADDAVLFAGPLDNAIDEAIALRLKLEDMPSNTVEDVEAQEQLLQEAHDKIARLRCAADMLVSAEFLGKNETDKQERIRHAAVVSGHYIENGPTKEFETKASKDCPVPRMFHWPLEFPEVIRSRGGFDAIVGNPPFLGGIRISGTLGNDYLHLLQIWGKGNRADLCAYFLYRSYTLLAGGASFGLIGTNTISQGDTREFGLDRIVAEGGTIHRASSSRRWPGAASLQIAEVWVSKAEWRGIRILDEHNVDGITSYFEEDYGFGAVSHHLAANRDTCFKGVDPMGQGFLLSHDEAQSLFRVEPQSREVLFKYLNGQELYGRHDQASTRWAIYFRNWPLDKSSASVGYSGQVAANYPKCLQHVDAFVRPYRRAKDETGDYKLGKSLSSKWWIFNRPRIELFKRAIGLSRVLVRPEVSSTHAMVFLTPDILFSNLLCVFLFEDYSHFSILQSTLHECWARFNSSSMGNTMRYITGDCYESFPFVPGNTELDGVGDAYYSHRLKVLSNFQEGLTQIYNRFHDPEESSTDIYRLRELHSELDQEVANAYGWRNLDLQHGFHKTRQGVRFTVSESARRIILRGFFKLNHERYAQEVKQGLHKKKKGAKKKSAPKKRAAKKAAERQEPSLFDVQEPEDRWYFAYGSNLSINRKEDRTGAIRRAEVVVLKNYRLAFNKHAASGNQVYANIMPAAGEETTGVAYLCNPTAFAKLDRHEGVSGGHYLQQNVTVVTQSGEPLEAIAYIAGPDHLVEEQPPSETYLGHILQGAEDHGLPVEYIEKIKRIASGS